MGYDTGTPAAKRAAVEGASHIYVDGLSNKQFPQYKSLTCDFAAWFRYIIPHALDKNTSPTDAIRHFLWPSLFSVKKEDTIIPSIPTLRYVVFCFDNGALIPEMRHIFYDEKRYKKEDRAPRADEVKIDGRIFKRHETPIDDDEVALITEDSMPATWIRVLNSPKGKSKLWFALIESLKRVIAENNENYPDTVFVIDGCDNQRWMSVPEHLKHDNISECMTPLTYGEGDLKFLHWAIFLEHMKQTPVLQVSVDWDTIIAATLYNTSIHALVSIIYVAPTDSGTFLYDATRVASTLTSTTARTWIQPKEAYEIIDIGVIVKRHPDIVKRYELYMLMLCNGGVDYCDGVARFGFTESTILPLLTKFHADPTTMPKWLQIGISRKNPFQRILSVDAGKFVQMLMMQGPYFKSKAMKASTSEFNREFRNMLWCLCYAGGWDFLRKPGGPGIPDYDTAMFFDPVKYPLLQIPLEQHVHVSNVVLIREECPITSLSDLPYTPCYSFVQEQIERMK